MKAHFLLLGLFGLSSGLAQQHTPAKVTLLMVIGHGFAEEQVFTVTDDSVLAVKRNLSEEGTQQTRYARALTSQERTDLLSSFNNVYLSTLKPSYEAINAPTDDMTFTLYIQKGETVKNIQIYRYKLSPLYTFSKKLNRLLPLAFQLDYNDGYFSN